MKKKILLSALFVFLPLKVNAANVSLSVNCDKILLTNDYAKCTLDGEVTDGSISGFQTDFSYDSNMNFRFEKNSVFSGSVDEGDKNIALYTEGESITGKFNIGTFILKNYSNTGEISTLSFSNSKVSVDTEDNVVDQDVTINSISIKNASHERRLSDIKINGKSIENFDKDEEFYEVELNDKNVTITASAINEFAKIEGLVENKKLNYGDNKFTIDVTSESGSKNSYIIYITRPEIRQIKSITMNGEKFHVVNDVYSHTKEFKNNVSSIVFDAELVNDTDVDFVEGFGPRTVNNLVPGKNVVLFKTVDKNGDVLTYTINVVVPGDKDNSSTNNKEENKTEDKKEENKTDNKKEDVKNPDTGVNVSIIAVLSISIIAVVSYVILRKKNYFKKI